MDLRLPEGPRSAGAQLGSPQLFVQHDRRLSHPRRRTRSTVYGRPRRCAVSLTTSGLAALIGPLRSWLHRSTGPPSPEPSPTPWPRGRCNHHPTRSAPSTAAAMAGPATPQDDGHLRWRPTQRTAAQQAAQPDCGDQCSSGSIEPARPQPNRRRHPPRPRRSHACPSAAYCSPAKSTATENSTHYLEAARRKLAKPPAVPTEIRGTARPTAEATAIAS